MDTRNKSYEITSNASRTGLPFAMSALFRKGFNAKHLTPGETCTRAEILHLLSAHKYLSSALRAKLLNNSSEAIHLAYYSQLRSVLSIYAGSGIFIKQHPTGSSFFLNRLNSNTKVTIDSVRTHDAIHELWSDWSVSSTATAVINSIEIVPNLTMGDVSQSLTGINYIKDFVAKLCYDIISLKDDHIQRNIASYEPESEIVNFDALKKSAIYKHKYFLTSTLEGGISNKIVDLQLFFYSLMSLASSQGKTTIDLINDIDQSTGCGSSMLLALLQESPIKKPWTISLAKENIGHENNIVARSIVLARIAELLLKINTPADQKINLNSFISSWLKSTNPNIINERSTNQEIFEIFSSNLDDFSKLNLDSNPSIIWDKRNTYTTMLSTRSDLAIAWH